MSPLERKKSRRQSREYSFRTSSGWNMKYSLFSMPGDLSWTAWSNYSSLYEKARFNERQGTLVCFTDEINWDTSKKLTDIVYAFMGEEVPKQLCITFPEGSMVNFHRWTCSTTPTRNFPDGGKYSTEPSSLTRSPVRNHTNSSTPSAVHFHEKLNVSDYHRSCERSLSPFPRDGKTPEPLFSRPSKRSNSKRSEECAASSNPADVIGAKSCRSTNCCSRDDGQRPMRSRTPKAKSRSSQRRSSLQDF